MTLLPAGLRLARHAHSPGLASRFHMLRPLAAASVVAATSAVFATGCAGAQREPTDYAGAEEAFLTGCVSVAESDGDAIGLDMSGQPPRTRISSPSDYCRCVFDEVSAAVPFADFKRINATLRDEGGPLPGAFREAYASCDPASEADPG